jgi:SAM-dependent methyltransferase
VCQSCRGAGVRRRALPAQFYDYDVESTRRFFERFGEALDVARKSVLDIGCGRGATAIEAARRGASRVVGVDLDVAPQARELVARDPELAGRIELVQTTGELAELGSQTFDVVLSKDSFEHYADPESFALTMARFLRPRGLLAIGFGPLWRSPSGGHMEYMTPPPWAHLLFPEDVIMEERTRFRMSAWSSGRAMSAGRRSVSPFKVTRASSYASSSGAITGPR